MRASGTLFGAQSMAASLEIVLVRRPDDAFGRADPATWHYTGPIDLPKAQREHDDFVRILAEFGAEIVYHGEPLPNHADAIYVHDPVLVTDRGAVLLRMGKALRRGEEAAIGRTLESIGVPVHARLEGEALAEGGDLLWIDERTLAVGQGYRTNAEGLRQLQAALPEVEMFPVQLPHAGGPEACLHLMSFISIVSGRLAAAYLPLMPVPFLQFLERRGFGFVEVPDSEYPTMGPNVLALAPGRCVMLEGNAITKSRLEAAGCSVTTYRGQEISLRAEGGPTCLTRPVLRAFTRPAPPSGTPPGR